MSTAPNPIQIPNNYVSFHIAEKYPSIIKESHEVLFGPCLGPIMASKTGIINLMILFDYSRKTVFDVVRHKRTNRPCFRVTALPRRTLDKY